MKIPTSISANSINLSSITGKETVIKSNVPDTEKVTVTGRYDTLEVSSGNTTAELIRNLDKMSEEEKEDLAVCAYIDMQRSCKGALDGQEIRMSIFKARQEEKAYYNELKANGGVISEAGGKYAFMDREAGTVVDMKYIDNAIADVQENIDSLLTPISEKKNFNGLSDTIFGSAAALFSAITGVSEDKLNFGDDTLYKIREGLTEENYLQRSEETINAIKEKTEQLRSIFNEYANGRDEIMQKLERFCKSDTPYERKHEQLQQVLDKYGDEINALPFKLNLFYNPFPNQFGEDYTMKIPQE